MQKNLIQIENLIMNYGDRPVLDRLSFALPQGIRCAIVGPNGAGKSTLLKGILGLLRPVAGEIRIFGEPIDRVRKRIAYVPQRSSVRWDFPTTAADVVLMGRYAQIGLFRRPKKEDLRRVAESMEEMRLTELADRQISELSGGQQQRVFLARALASDAELFILDEPLAGVDDVTEHIIINRFKELQREGKSVLSVHHDLSTIEAYFDYIVAIGESVTAGSLSSVNLSDLLFHTFHSSACAAFHQQKMPAPEKKGDLWSF